MGADAARVEDSWLTARARTLVKLRAAVYSIGLLLGALAMLTGSRTIFAVMSGVLLSPAAAALLARASRARRIRFTQEGKVVLLFGTGFLAAALNTGTNLLYVLFALVAAQLLASRVASWAVLRALFVKRRAPSRVRARDAFPVEVSVRNGKLFAAYALLLEEARREGLDPIHRAAAFLPRVGGRETARATYETSFLERGEHTLQGLAVETRFPFGLIARRVELAAPQTVLATPVVHDVRPQVLDLRATSEAPARRPVATFETQAAVRSLRDYRPGDHPRAIHWRASARRGSLVVKELERSEPDRALVVLDAWTGGRTSLSDAERALLVEEAVTLAASLVTSLAARGESPGLAARAPRVVVHAPGRADPGGGAPLGTLATLAPPLDGDLAEVAQAARRAAHGARLFVVTTRPEASAREGLAALLTTTARFLELARPGELGRFLELRDPHAKQGGVP
jgi:uncharacterized protein (DUF58 family)